MTSYKHICHDVPKICENKCDDVNYSTSFRQEVNTWYSQNGNTLLDKIIAYHDDRRQMMQQFCAPVNLIDYHWIVIDVIMPCSKYSNGKVFLTNHAADDKIPVS